MTRPGGARWPVAIVMLHWSTAALALATAGYGIYLLSPPDWSQPYLDRYAAGIGWHKGGGLTVLALALCWTVLRTRLPRPPLAARGAMRGLVLGVHGLLLALVILLPASGYVMDSLAGHGIALPGGITIPPLLPRSDRASMMLSYPHKWAGYALLGLAALHLLGALRHALRPGDSALGAMLPRLSSRK